AERGIILVTVEEWDERGKEAHEGQLKALAAHQSAELVALRDKYASVVDRLTDLHQGDMEAEHATLRAQLADKQQKIDADEVCMQEMEDTIRDLQTRIERMRPPFPGRDRKANLLLQ